MGDPPWLAEVITSGTESPEPVEQLVVHRRVGQHHPDVGQAGRDLVGERAPARRAPARSARPASSARRRPRRRSRRLRRGRSDIGDHHGERLGGPGLSAPQLGYRRRRRRRGRPDESPPIPLTATISAGRQRGTAAADRVTRPAPAGRPPRQRGPQSGQAMVCAWKRRSSGSWYSAGAPRAHRELAPSWSRPVVGQVGDDGVARPAVGAGDERVPVPAVGRVAHFAQAVLADRDVRRDAGCASRRRCGCR